MQYNIYNDVKVFKIAFKWTIMNLNCFNQVSKNFLQQVRDQLFLHIPQNSLQKLWSIALNKFIQINKGKPLSYQSLFKTQFF